MSHPIDNYINYKNENVAIYTKKEFENSKYLWTYGRKSIMDAHRVRRFGVNNRIHR